MISVFEDNREEQFNTIYNHNILKENAVGGQSWQKTIEQYDGNIYCVQVPTGRLIVKRGRCTMVCGNSGNPADILCGKSAIQGFENHEYAKDILKDRAYEEAEECCGEDMTGNDEYSYIYKVENRYYKMTFKPFYNRYDKRFYYVDGFDNIDFEEYDIKLEDIGLIEALWNIFGGTITPQGYKVLDGHIGAIYGDSITFERAKEICERLEAKGFASTNVVYGIGL